MSKIRRLGLVQEPSLASRPRLRTGSMVIGSVLSTGWSANHRPGPQNARRLEQMMNVDPEICVVVFGFEVDSGQQNARHAVQTRADDGIQQAWKAISEQHRLHPKHVAEIYSEWSATESDVAFMKSQMPSAPFSYSYVRPESDELWDDAMAAAISEMMSESEGEGAPDFEPGIMPVLRNNDPANSLNELFVSAPLGHSGLLLALANVAPTPHGTIGADWVMLNSVEEDQIDDLWEQALENLSQSLQVQVGQSDSGEKYAVVSHPAYHGASAVGLPGFLMQATEWVEADTLFVGIPGSECILIAPLGSGVASELRNDVLSSQCMNGEPLSPCCFEFDGESLRRTATHPNGEFTQPE